MHVEAVERRVRQKSHSEWTQHSIPRIRPERGESSSDEDAAGINNPSSEHGDAILPERIGSTPGVQGSADAGRCDRRCRRGHQGMGRWATGVHRHLTPHNRLGPRRAGDACDFLARGGRGQHDYHANNDFHDFSLSSRSLRRPRPANPPCRTPTPPCLPRSAEPNVHDRRTRSANRGR